ncbi:acyl-CoA thioesterase [Aquimarina sp. W85]|uniref:acyl-CoA thioesterase n=1 Tax=Aquimarina rhodophyticola TaxID=3342246 RepID=UPI00366C3F95
MKRKNRSKERVTNLKNIHQVRVRFNDCDPLNIVWHGIYVTYFEEGREAFGRSENISYLDVKSNNFVTPIVNFNCDHKLPLTYGDIATIETIFVDSPAAKMIFKYNVYNQREELVCSGETTQVFLDMNGVMSLTIPDFFMDWKRKVGLVD